MDPILDSLGATAVPANAVLDKDLEIDLNSQELTPAPSLSSVEEKALKLLSIGISNEQVANALGVTPGRISQMLSNDEFSNQVAQAKYLNLQQHSERDSKYDSLEDKLLGKLESALPLMMRPDTILKAINVVNNAKRRGSTDIDPAAAKQQIVSLVLPTQVVQQFQTNINNQVTKAGEQELLTMTSANLLKRVEKETQIPLGATQAQLAATVVAEQGNPSHVQVQAETPEE